MTNFEKVLALITAEYQRLETAWQELGVLADAYTQTGINLDRLGRRVGVLRNGRSDAAMSAAILSAYTQEMSGTINQVNDYLHNVLGVTTFTRTREANGTDFIEVTSGTIPTIAQLEEVAPAGVALLPADYLVTADGQGVVTADGHGVMVVYDPVASTTTGYGYGAAYGLGYGSNI